MKTNKLFAVAALLPVLFSCAKEEIRTNDNLSSDGQKYDFTITVSGDEDSITKASLSDTDGIFWVKGGKAGIVNGKANKESKVLDENNIVKQEGFNQATFQFEKVQAGDYKLYYPYREGSVLDKISFWVDLYQTTNVGSSADCFALVSDDMVSLTGDQGIPATTTYKVVGSYIRFLVYGKENEQVKSIAIKCENNSRIAGEYYVDGTNNSLKGVYYNGEDIILDLQGADCPTTLAKDDSKGLYAAILPSSEDFPTAKNTYVVTTDGGFYTFESASGKEFAFGSIKTLPLNLTKATKFSKTPEHLYIVGGATEIGWSCENAIELTKVDGKDQFEIKNIKLTAGSGDSGFKFLTTKGSWSKAYVNGLNDNKTITYYEDSEKANKDTKFSVDKAGYYDLVVDFDNNTVTPTLKTEFPSVRSYFRTVKDDNGNEIKQYNTYLMLPTGNEGEFKATAFLGYGGGYHDFYIYEGDNTYHEAVFREIASFAQENNYAYTGSVTLDATTDKGWYVNDNEYRTPRYYDITLNKKAGTVTVKFAQGKNFWLIGDPFNGFNAEKKEEFKATADENGIVSWEVTTTNTGEWKICGEYNLSESNEFWKGEWYYSTGTPFDWNLNGDNNYGKESDVNVFCGDQKWKFNETGKFRITFDSKNLKIKVEKLPESQE